MARDPLAQDVTERCVAKPPRPTKGYACQSPANCNVPSGCHITIWEALTLPGPPPSGPGWESSPDHQLHRAGNGRRFYRETSRKGQKSILHSQEETGVERGRTKRAPSNVGTRAWRPCLGSFVSSSPYTSCGSRAGSPKRIRASGETYV